MSSAAPPPPASRSRAVVTAGLALTLAWVFWPSFLPMAERWGEARYSHGYLVPLFSAYLLWSRRGMLAAGLAPSRWGLPVLLAGLLTRFVGTYIYFDWLAAAALLPCLAGLALTVGGRGALRWAWPAIAFLAFMIPLPYRAEVALALPLQRIATLTSTYALQTLGFAAASAGNTIRMGTVHLGVVEACNGLSMMMIFFALATAAAIVVRRPLYEKALLVASAVPIALAANIIRIVVTGVLHKTVGSATADYVFHDLAGWLMMPLALGMLWVELRLLHWVVQDVPADDGEPMKLPPRLAGDTAKGKAAKKDGRRPPLSLPKR